MTNFYLKHIKKTHYTLVCLLCIVLGSCKKAETHEAVEPIVTLERSYVNTLGRCIEFLDSTLASSNRDLMLKGYLNAREQFKMAEPILSFVDKGNYKSLNAPNILSVEEEDATDIKINNPFGFQVMEELLFEEPFDKVEFKKVAQQTRNRLELIKQNTHLKLKPYHVLWLIRDEVARIALTGITGFDSPVLEASMKESIIAYGSLKELLNIYKDEFASEALYNEFQEAFDKAIVNLNADFESFNRFNFIKNHTHKQLELLQRTKTDWEVEFPLELAFNNDMTSLFSSSTFNMDYFSGYVEVDSLLTSKISLGQRLFNDTRLSSDNSMSCATCHDKNKAFTDGLKAFPKQLRNTPTLTYAALQRSFFYDGRTGNLEGQIVDVVNNQHEFHTNLDDLKEVVSGDSLYAEQFLNLYGSEVSDHSIRNAIAVYIRSLNKFNSKFDNNINGLENTLSSNEVNGFNLFMGKAKCATCHFAPVFNGTIPPDFKHTEFELLGVPKDTLQETLVDSDLGRYNVFNTLEKKYFFKTPTVRNSSKTAPYMHNGVFVNLEQLMEFYNDGGGAGLGLELEYQTLPPDALGLTESEMKDIISFMESLEDS